MVVVEHEVHEDDARFFFFLEAIIFFGFNSMTLSASTVRT